MKRPHVNIYFSHECERVRGVGVVIDVLRAFTTSAYAFSKGIEQILLVGSPEEAFKQRSIEPALILTGESGRYPIEGFDYDNSPSQMLKSSLIHSRMLLHTTCGTKAALECAKSLSSSATLFLASFVVASATLEQLQKLNADPVSLIVTSSSQGDEDLALAHYLQSRLLGEKTSIEPYLKRARHSPSANRLLADAKENPRYREDLELALLADRFDFSMQASWVEGTLVAQAFK